VPQATGRRVGSLHGGITAKASHGATVSLTQRRFAHQCKGFVGCDPDPDSLPLQTRNFRLLIVGIPVVVKRELSIGPIQALQSSAKTYDP